MRKRKEWVMSMSKKKVIHVRAPKDVMENLRAKFPNVRDADLIRFTYNTSAIRLESGLRGMRDKPLFEKKKKRKDVFY